MAEHTNPTPATGVPTTTTEILAAITAEEPHGASADQVARTIGRGLDDEMVQGEMEELVARGLLDRRGLGRGAVYTLHATACCGARRAFSFSPWGTLLGKSLARLSGDSVKRDVGPNLVGC